MKLIKSELTQKLKHTSSILEYFEYYCKIDPHHFELYRFKVKTFFETQCRFSCLQLDSVSAHAVYVMIY